MKRNFPSEAHEALYTEFGTFLDNLTVEGRSPRTVASYETTYFMYAMTSSVIEDRRVRRFLLRYENPATRNKVLSHLKAFVSWYGTGNEYVPAPIHVREVQIPDSLPVSIDRNVSDALLKCLETLHKPTWAVCTLMRSTGMRIGEVLDLTRKHLYKSQDGGLEYGVRFYGKGKKERLVPLTPVALEAFRVWTSLRFKPHHMTIRRYMDKATKEIGVEHIKPHWFRSSLATRLVNRGIGFDQVAELLGHKSTDILRKRYARLDHTRLSALVQE